MMLERVEAAVIDRIELFGIPFSNVTFDDVCESIGGRIETHLPGYIVTPNVDHICRYQNDAEFREAYAHAFLVLADGTPVLWASRWLGKPLVQKLSGSDMVPALCDYAAQHGYSVYFLGAEPEVTAKAVGLLKEQYPGMKVSGFYSPPIGFYRDDKTNEEALRRIQEARPDLCFVAMGAPQQEIWMYRNLETSGATVMAGIGAGIDFVAGRQKRAPLWMQTAGMEWVWRLSHEPRRLWRRYLVDDLAFFPILWRELRKRARERASDSNEGAKD